MRSYAMTIEMLTITRDVFGPNKCHNLASYIHGHYNALYINLFANDDHANSIQLRQFVYYNWIRPGSVINVGRLQ